MTLSWAKRGKNYSRATRDSLKGCGFSLDTFGRVLFKFPTTTKTKSALGFGCDCIDYLAEGFLHLTGRFSVGISWQLAISDSGICPVRYHVSCMEATYITRARVRGTAHRITAAAGGHLCLSAWPMSSWRENRSSDWVTRQHLPHSARLPSLPDSLYQKPPTRTMIIY